MFEHNGPGDPDNYYSYYDEPMELWFLIISQGTFGTTCGG